MCTFLLLLVVFPSEVLELWQGTYKTGVWHRLGGSPVSMEVREGPETHQWQQMLLYAVHKYKASEKLSILLCLVIILTCSILLHNVPGFALLHPYVDCF